MRVLFDCGFYIGAFTTPRLDLFGKIYGFEIDASVIPPKWPGHVEIINKAVWINDGMIPWNKAENPTHNSIFQPRRKVIFRDSAPCLSLSRFIRENCDLENDQVTVKLDIEGAEYAVLNDLILEGVMDHIQEIHVEFHSRLWKNSGRQKAYREEESRLINTITAKGVKFVYAD